jgi:sugar phosphate isomerase/epimerase
MPLDATMSAPTTRRQFAKLALAALPVAALGGLVSRLGAEEGEAPRPRVDSRVAGVLIGLNVPYSFGNLQMSGQDILDRCVQLGISGLELRTQPVELYLGAPPKLVGAKAFMAAAAGANSVHAQMQRWRRNAPMDRVADFRRMYESAGIAIEIVKVDGIFAMSDDELDYVFALARDLGARALSTEISKKQDDLARLGGFGVKHGMWVAYHGHTAVGPGDWERAFALSPRNAANVDIGHFIAGNNYSPVPFIRQYHERITHVHIKDRKLHLGPNVPFGQGDTPIVEVLHLLRDNRWNIQATIEFEYKVPAGSDRMTEIAKCVKYCRDALLS